MSVLNNKQKEWLPPHICRAECSHSFYIIVSAIGRTKSFTIG